MKRQLPYPEAKRILVRVPYHGAFWLCTNQNLRSLADVAEALEKVDDDVFRYHVTRDKNDFEAWIREILRDKELAREIARVKTKETLIRKINERVLTLRAIVKRHTAIIEKIQKRAKAHKKRKATRRKARARLGKKRKRR